MSAASTSSPADAGDRLGLLPGQAAHVGVRPLARPDRLVGGRGAHLHRHADGGEELAATRTLGGEDDAH